MKDKMKKKVLFVVPTLVCGGAETYVIQAIEFLHNDYDITLYIDNPENESIHNLDSIIRVIRGDTDRGHSSKNIKVLFSKLFKSREYTKQLIHSKKSEFTAQKNFAGEHYDVVIANHIFSFADMIRYISADRRYLIFHGSKDTHHEKIESMIPYLDGLIGVSPGACDMLRNAFPSMNDKVFTIPNYISYTEITEKSNEECPIEIPEKPSLCTCGRISGEKGFDLAVEAAKILRERNIDFVWYFVGDGYYYREKIEKSVEKYQLYDIIEILGLRENPHPFIKACDIYVQPSLEESYCRTIKEAMILGKPIVSTDTVGARYLLEDGKKGILCDIDANALADGIQTMIEGNRKQFTNLFTAEKSKKEEEEFINLWNTILSK